MSNEPTGMSEADAELWRWRIKVAVLERFALSNALSLAALAQRSATFESVLQRLEAELRGVVLEVARGIGAATKDPGTVAFHADEAERAVEEMIETLHSLAPKKP